jgi:hypothetical protein
MMEPRRKLVGRLLLGAVLAVAVSAASSVAGVAPAGAQSGAVLTTGPVSAKPAGGTPQLARTRNTTEVVRQLVQCGGTMYAVGSFTKIKQNGTVYRRSSIFSFSASSPFSVTSWNPDVIGRVNSITFSGGDCADAYIGGMFTSVHGTRVSDIAEIDTTTGHVIPRFRHHANGQVETLLGYAGHILAGGYYTTINGSRDNRYMTSLNHITGKDDGYLHLHISGHYRFPGAAANPTRVYNQQLSHSETLDLVEGDFTSVGGRPRQQVFMLSLGASSGRVTGWTSAEFDRHCSEGHPFYVHAGSWSPNDSTVYLATTGFHPLTNGKAAGGLCDVAAAFPATQRSVTPTWRNYTGCWSLYSTAADSAAVYIGGHEEYANNPKGCKTAGPGAVSDPGLGGLNPSGGSVLLDAQGTAGLYSRSRGEGADDMLLTSAGLWVASDNGVYSSGRFHLSSACGGVRGHAGICFLPYADSNMSGS